MQIGIHGKEILHAQCALIESIFKKLYEHEARLSVSSKFMQHLRKWNLPSTDIQVFEQGDDLRHLDVFISLGGDGTLLDSITYVEKKQIPVLGINTGSMGFLATIGYKEIFKALVHLFEGSYRVDTRTTVTIFADTGLFGKLNFALNDFTILKKGISSMINVCAYVDSELLNSYWADGVIVSTPTGSTGYSLSCGGPLIYPTSDVFIITPINPHNFAARPIIVPDTCEVKFRVQCRTKKILVSLDSRFETVDDSVEIKLKKGEFKIRLIEMPEGHYFKTLRQKLNWGLDIRN